MTTREILDNSNSHNTDIKIKTPMAIENEPRTKWRHKWNYFVLQNNYRMSSSGNQWMFPQCMFSGRKTSSSSFLFLSFCSVLGCRCLLCFLGLPVVLRANALNQLVISDETDYVFFFCSDDVVVYRQQLNQITIQLAQIKKQHKQTMMMMSWTTSTFGTGDE